MSGRTWHGTIVQRFRKKDRNGTTFLWFKLDHENSEPLFIAYPGGVKGLNFLKAGNTVTVEGDQPGGRPSDTVFVSRLTHRSTVINGYRLTNCSECHGFGISFPEDADEPKMHCDSCGRRVDLV